MIRKRNRLGVIYDILEIIREHQTIKPTPLLRYSNLSSSGGMEYLTELMSKGLIQEGTDKEGRKYLSLTAKGLQYLEKYTLIKGFIEEFEL